MFTEELEHENTETTSRERELALPGEEEELVKSLKEQAFYVLKHLRELEAKDSYRQKDELLMNLVQQVANSPNKLNVVELIRHAAMQLVDAAYVSFFLIDVQNAWMKMAASDGRFKKKLAS